MDRAHRIGQKKEVQVFRFCIENSIEEKVRHPLTLTPAPASTLPVRRGHYRGEGEDENPVPLPPSLSPPSALARSFPARRFCICNSIEEKVTLGAMVG